MAEIHVKVFKIGKYQAEIRCLLYFAQRRIPQLRQLRGMDFLRNAAMGVNIVNGTDSDYVSARRFNAVEQSLAKRLRCIILTIGRTGKRSVFLSHKRTGNNSPDIIRLNIFVSNLAKPVKSVQTKMIFMGGNLHIAVG